MSFRPCPLSLSNDKGAAGNDVIITASATASGQTGVEMEALTAVAFAGINILSTLRRQLLPRLEVGPMIGGSDNPVAFRISDIHLVSKKGGKSGEYLHQPVEEENIRNTQPDSFGALRVSRDDQVVAVARVFMPSITWKHLVHNINKKGDVLGVARLAGIMAADQTKTLLPMTLRPSQSIPEVMCG